MAFDETTAIAMRDVARLEAENAKLRAVCAELLSVRDQFAKAAMQGCIASGRFMGYAACAADSYAMADAMMAVHAAHGVTEAPASMREALAFFVNAWDGGEVEWFKNCYEAVDKARAALGVMGVQPQQAVQCAFCERPMIAGSECLTADRAAACEVRTTGVALPATGWKADKLGSSLAWPADTSTDAAGAAGTLNEQGGKP